MRFFQFWIIQWLITLLVLHLSLGLTVTFSKTDPLYIKLGKTLVLEAQVQKNPDELIILQTWELKNNQGEVRVAENDRTNNNRTFVEKEATLLRIINFQDSDCGRYKITVTDGRGQQIYAQREVLKITNPPEVSLSMHCNVQSQGAKWDATRFSWQVNGVALTNQTGFTSQDGSTLFLKSLGQNYTCSTESSQGTSNVTLQVKEPEPDPEPDSCNSSVWIAIAVLELVILVILCGLLWYCYKKIQENHRDNL